MKYTNKQKKLAGRINHFSTDRTIQESNKKHPGSYTKPGSYNK
jgi:hypothetical protein